MRPRGVATLAALGLVAVLGGWYFGTRTTPDEQTTIARGQLMFPDLAPKLRDVARIEITHQARQTVIEKRPDGGWGVASMHDYPVQEARLRGMLTGLTELRLAEPRTSDPAEYSRLGVDDPNGSASSADLLRLVDTKDKPVVALIVGHRRVRSQANVPEEVYVRRPDQNQSWLAEGSLQVDADASLWLDRNVMNIAHDRIASVAVNDQALTFARRDGKFVLTQPAQHPNLEDYKVDDVARGLELLTFQEVKADADAPGSEAGHAVFTTNDGLAVTVTVFHAEKDVWARFAVSGGSDKVKAEAQRMNARVAGWSYQIGSWKEKSLVPSMADLKAEEPAKPPSPSPGPTAATPTSGTPTSGTPTSGTPIPGTPTSGTPTPGTPTPVTPAPRASDPGHK
ncbi:DUF4340 domain-containing protein [Rhodopila sp.]|uniref:DUF4340 domain-containing protein n=1 Tax=Rhodopila sp. TaxID=2480087 RepID=UPI003D095FDC